MQHGCKYWLYQPYKWLILIPFFFIETLIFTFYIFLVSPFSHRLAFYGGVWWAKAMQWATPMPVRVVGRENISEGQSYVIVSNHQSGADIVAIYGSIGMQFRWILKKELRKAPMLGYACEKMQHIFIDRSSARAAYRSIEKAKEILTGGTSVVIFPEGTRSKTGEMGTFKHGAFKMAFELGLPILPITLNGTHNVMSGGLDTLTWGKAEMIIHKPIDTMRYRDNRDQLIEITRATIAEGMRTKE